MTTHEHLNTFNTTTPRQFTLAIVESVAHRHGVPVKAIMSRDRHAHIIAARHEAIAEVVEARPYWSYPTVGKLFGLDHTSVIHALQKLGKWKPRGYGPNHGGIPTACWHIGQFCAALEIDWQGGAQ
jgi:chromosomal replication initiation ATPase DnaA